MECGQNQVESHRCGESSARASAGLPRALAIGNGGKSYSDCIMPEVNPPADVPGPIWSHIGKHLLPGRKLTDAEESAHGGKRELCLRLMSSSGWSSSVRPSAHGSRGPKIRNSK